MTALGCPDQASFDGLLRIATDVMVLVVIVLLLLRNVEHEYVYEVLCSRTVSQVYTSNSRRRMVAAVKEK